MATDTAVAAAELERRTIRRSDYLSCNTAFIDCKTPGSDTKENYSIVGSGVTQNADQVINLEQRHGFNVGAAAMPHGVTNNLHMHYTAEVFLNFRGDWLLRWGTGGADGEHKLRDGDIATLPTWIFRGFTNVGRDDGWLFTIPGFDNTGGIIWDPSIIAEAAVHGLYIRADNQLLDTAKGDIVDGSTALLPTIGADDLAELRTWTAEEMAGRIVSLDDLNWSDLPFLCSRLGGGRARYAQVIGYGMTENRHLVPPVHHPHGHNIAWLQADRCEGLLTHRQSQPQVLIVYSGRWRVTLNTGADTVVTEIGPDDTLSVPEGAWRRFEVLSDETAQMVVVNAGDGRVRLDWADDVVSAARAGGLARDAGGYLGSAAVIAMSALDD